MTDREQQLFEIMKADASHVLAAQRLSFEGANDRETRKPSGGGSYGESTFTERWEDRKRRKAAERVAAPKPEAPKPKAPPRPKLTTEEARRLKTRKELERRKRLMKTDPAYRERRRAQKRAQYARKMADPAWRERELAKRKAGYQRKKTRQKGAAIRYSGPAATVGPAATNARQRASNGCEDSKREQVSVRVGKMRLMGNSLKRTRIVADKNSLI